MNNPVVYLMFWLSILLEPQVLQDVEVVLGVAYSFNFEDTGCSTKQVVCSKVVQNFDGLVMCVAYRYVV